MPRAFAQVDVFSDVPYHGNPVAVVLDGDGLDTESMQQLANWMNLSETTFVLPPTTPEADYRVRIFTPSTELPFAGHPTLGTCHAWLAHRGEEPRDVVQECGAGLVRIRSIDGRLAFAAPPLLRSGPVEEDLVDRIAVAFDLERGEIVDAQWVDNGPGWVAVMLADAQAVRDLPLPDAGELYVGAVGDVGVVGPHPAGGPADFEVRAFFPKDGATAEDPVTGSLNASLADWLLRTGRATAPYVVAQGGALGRAGRVYVSQDGDGAIWVAGGTVTCVSGVVEI